MYPPQALSFVYYVFQLTSEFNNVAEVPNSKLVRFVFLRKLKDVQERRQNEQRRKVARENINEGQLK